MCPRFGREYLSLNDFFLNSISENSNNILPNLNNISLNINDYIALDNYLNRLNNIEQSLSSPSMNSDNNSNSTLNSKTNTIFGYSMPVDIFSAFYTTTITAGGIVGYLKAGSKPSLAAGLVFGGLLGMGTYFTSVNPDNCHLTLGTSTVLAGVMGVRFFRTSKFMPAGLICALSLSMVTRCIYQIVTSKMNKKFN